MVPDYRDEGRGNSSIRCLIYLVDLRLIFVLSLTLGKLGRQARMIRGVDHCSFTYPNFICCHFPRISARTLRDRDADHPYSLLLPGQFFDMG